MDLRNVWETVSFSFFLFSFVTASLFLCSGGAVIRGQEIGIVRGYGGPSMDSATPCLHKGHIFGSIKLVAVFFCAHLRAHTVLWASCI